MIVTKEILHVTSKIAGTYHSKVKLVSKGLNHIGTTLDPKWFGHSLITIHNVSDKDIDLKCDETIVSLTFHYLDKPSKNFTLDNHSGRTDILNELGMANIPVEIGEEGIGDLEECYHADSLLRRENRSSIPRGGVRNRLQGTSEISFSEHGQSTLSQALKVNQPCKSILQG